MNTLAATLSHTSLLLTLCLVSSCGLEGAPESFERRQAWTEARQLWNVEHSQRAWGAWNAFPASSEEGSEARRLLERADLLYRRGIEELEHNAPEARTTFAHAVRIAPMNPELYLPLARAYRQRSQEDEQGEIFFLRAVEYYDKFLLTCPQHPSAPAARNELNILDPANARMLSFGEEPSAPSSRPRATPPPARWATFTAIAALLLALTAVLVLLLRPRIQRTSLAEVAQTRPELHPAIAYLSSTLRHELLKHRIGAIREGIQAWARGEGTEAQKDFLCGRLYSGEPLREAWEGHLQSFERTLGAELDLDTRDKHFRKATQAIDSIARHEAAIRRGERVAFRQLAKSQARLAALDDYLATLVQSLVRTTVDGQMLRNCVQNVRQEYAAAKLRLDELEVRTPDPAPVIEVFRNDLELILKNLIRNAILAMEGSEPPHRLGLEVTTNLEMTGEEIVRIHIRDTSHKSLSTEHIHAQRFDRGLGLVTSALRRYEGAIHVETMEGEWRKAVILRFFHAFEEDEYKPSPLPEV